MGRQEGEPEGAGVPRQPHPRRVPAKSRGCEERGKGRDVPVQADVGGCPPSARRGTAAGSFAPSLRAAQRPFAQRNSRCAPG